MVGDSISIRAAFGHIVIWPMSYWEAEKRERCYGGRDWSRNII